MVNFQKTYNELKKRSFDIALRTSDLENALGVDHVKILKLKKSFSKLQSAVNFALYYRKNKMLKEANIHIKYAYDMTDYLYSILEVIEVPKTEVELRLKMDKKYKKAKKQTKKGFKIKLSRKWLIWFVVLGVAYTVFMYLFFIR